MSPVPGRRAAAALFCLLLTLSSLHPGECGIAAASGGAAFALRNEWSTLIGREKAPKASQPMRAQYLEGSRPIRVDHSA